MAILKLKIVANATILIQMIISFDDVFNLAFEWPGTLNCYSNHILK